VNYKNSFELISVLSKEKGITCVLIGGFAVNNYNYARQTMDVDFIITKEDFDKIFTLLINQGYEQEYKNEVFIQLKNSKQQFMDLDFMFVDRDTLSMIIEDSKKTTISGQKFIVPSLNHLIALKLHAVKYNPHMRANIDLQDIINLVKINHLDHSSVDFKNLCLKYGTKEIYDTILRLV